MTATVEAPAAAAEAPVEAPPTENVRLGERVIDRALEAEPAAEETPLELETQEEPQAAEPAQTQHSPDFEAGFEEALRQLAEYDQFAAETRQRDETYAELGRLVGMDGAQVQQLLEGQVRQQLLAQRQEQLTAAEMEQRSAGLHLEREALLDATFAKIEEGVGQFDRGDVLARAQELVADPEFAADAGPRAPETAFYVAAEESAAQIAEGNARIEGLIAKANKYIGADAEAVRAAADRAFDPSAPDERGEVARAIFEGFKEVGTPVRFGQRVTDRYGAIQQIYREMATPEAPPRPQVQMQQQRDQLGRFVSNAERVTDRYAREAREAAAEQQRLAAHKERMKGTL